MTGTVDPKKRRQELHDAALLQARTDQQASSDSFDNQLLTFSSGALGLSLAFVKDLVPLKTAIWIPCLYLSWIAFAVCIIATIASFRFGIEAQKQRAGHLYHYYILEDDSYLDRKTGWLAAITWCAYTGAATFFTGLLLTLIFVLANITYLRMPHVSKEEPHSTSQSYCVGCTITYQDDSGQKQDCGEAAGGHGARRRKHQSTQICPVQREQ